jgi:hypothetical protein
LLLSVSITNGVFCLDYDFSAAAAVINAFAKLALRCAAKATAKWTVLEERLDIGCHSTISPTGAPSNE